MFLALANTILIAIGVSAVEVHDRMSMVFIVMVVGGVPAALVGLVVGSIAGALAAAPRWIRYAILIPPPLGLVAVLSLTFRMTTYFAVACIPTLAATLLLERYTRRVAPLPTATARAS